MRTYCLQYEADLDLGCPTRFRLPEPSNMRHAAQVDDLHKLYNYGLSLIFYLLVVVVYMFSALLIPCWKFGQPKLGNTTATARSKLPSLDIVKSCSHISIS